VVIVEIQPIFGKTDFRIEKGLTYVLMPFKEDLNDIYKTYILPTAKRRKLNVVRADDDYSNPVIMQKIWRSICKAQIVIADLTYLNPNVLYEVGIAHTLGKDTILIFQKRNKFHKQFPFDLVHIQRIQYENTAMGAKKLTSELSKALKSALAEKKQQLWSENELDIELKRYLQSQYTLRKKRIDWFSSYALEIIKSIKQQHLQLLKSFDLFRKDRDETSLNSIKAITENEYNDVEHNILPYMTLELSKVEDYLESPYLVYRLPEILKVIATAITGVRNSQLNLIKKDDLLPLRGLIVLAISNIKFVLQSIEEERKVVGLPPLP